MNVYYKFTGRINRRLPRNEGNFNDPVMRENLVSRDGVTQRPRGTQRFTTSAFSGKPTWAARYYSVESSIVAPKSFVYTQDGKLWYLTDQNGDKREIKSDLNQNAYPKHWMFKTGEQTVMYFVDGKDLYRHDGNNDHRFDKVTITDTDGNSIEPIDVIEHKDRLILISKTFVYVSKNLFPDIFNDADDSIVIVVGSGKGKNLALGKIEDNLYIFNTEGIFALSGDVISALAATFEVALVDEKKIIAGRTLKKVENALVFLADDFNIWSWNGAVSTKLSHDEKLEDFVNTKREFLDMAVATYFNNYYMLSFVEKGEYTNNLEIWWDALESKIDFIRDRRIADYLEIDSTKEEVFQQICYTKENVILWTERGYDFDGSAIVSRLLTRDITIKKGRNVRFSAFYPEIEPTGTREMVFRYMLDGRLSDLDDRAKWTQSMRGDAKVLGDIRISNQEQVTYRIRPQINYSRGTSICFYINDSTHQLRFRLLGITIEYVDKKMKKGRLVGA